MFQSYGEKQREVCFSDSSLMMYSHLAKQFFFFSLIYEGRGSATLQRNSYLQPGCHRCCWQLLLMWGILLLPAAALVAGRREGLPQQAGSSDS